MRKSMPVQYLATLAWGKSDIIFAKSLTSENQVRIVNFFKFDLNCELVLN